MTHKFSGLKWVLSTTGSALKDASDIATCTFSLRRIKAAALQTRDPVSDTRTRDGVYSGTVIGKMPEGVNAYTAYEEDHTWQ